MKYQAEYRTVSGKFFQREFATKGEFEDAKSDLQRSKRQGVDKWDESTPAGDMTFIVPLDKVEAVIFLKSEEPADLTSDSA